MKPQNTHKTYGLITLLFILSLLIITKGCKKDRSPIAPGRTLQGMKVRLGGSSELQAKVIALSVVAEGIDNNGVLTGDKVSKSVSMPTFPLDVHLTLYDPPCRWKITVTLTLQRDGLRTGSAALNVCQSNHVQLTLDTFEILLVPPGVNPITAPASAQAGETIPVSCGPVDISVPDSDTYPPAADLSEQGGQSFSGPIDASTGVSGSFPDPHASTSLQTQRWFTCRIYDGRSPDQTFTKMVTRIAPTPTPTVTPTITPTVTPTVTPTISLPTSEQSQSWADMRAINTALGSYLVDFNFFPNYPIEVDVGPGVPLPLLYHSGPYTDGWGRAFRYISVGPIIPGNEYTLKSYGKDGLPGGSGEDDDIICINGILVAPPYL